jgi:hypothetical protein
VRRCKQRKIRYQHSDSLPVCLIPRNFLATRSAASTKIGGRTVFYFFLSHSLKMEPRPFLWLRITRPMATV